MQDDSQDMTLTAADLADAMSHDRSIDPPRARDWPMVDGEDHHVAEAGRNHHDPGLHARPLFGQHKFATVEIRSGPAEQQGRLKGKRL